MQKFSFNIHAQNLTNAEKEALLTLFRQQKPETALILNDAAFASQVADIVPYTILRMTNNDDEIQLKLRSFNEWWQLVKANYTDKRLIVYFCNEPHSNFMQLSALVCQGIDVLLAEGLRGVFGNFGVGTPEPSDWQNALKPMLDKLAESGMFLGLHEYMMYAPTLSIPYEISRYQHVPNNVRILFTEFGFDYIEAIWQGNQHLKARGWKDHVKYLQSMSIPDPEPTLVQMLISIFKSFYNADNRVIGVNYFCYGDSGGWDNYNVLSWEYLLEHLEGFRMAQTITVLTPTMVNIKGKTGKVNRRLAPNTNAVISGTISDMITVSKIAVTNDGWTEYVFSDGTFWLNDAVVEVVENAEVTISIANATPEEVAAFKQLLNDLHSFITTHDVEFS